MTTAEAQPVTLELQEWLAQQIAAGTAASDLIAAMKASGWAEQVAHAALQRFTGGTVKIRLPEPDLVYSPTVIQAGDRAVQVLLSLDHPRIVLFGDFLSSAECDELVEMARPRMIRSKTVSDRDGIDQTHDARTSTGTYFHRGTTDLVSRIDARIAHLVNWPVDHGEGLQVLNYAPGAEYKPHFDYFDPSRPGSAVVIGKAGQRVGTLVMYLNEPEQGGATVFPDAGLSIMPRKGSAVFFSYARPDASTGTLHGGAPVIAGEKWIATKWLRERVF
ncbi:MAG: proline dioxygenase [Ramlibacter sp.]|jgi:prolyl 4-hydroxylase|nr:proline dioxygenase [Ramlibacter sp.]